MTNQPDPQASQNRLRKLIGSLGILLPIILWVVHKELLSSMSHYYYTSASVFFIAILGAFGLMLVSFKGYTKSAQKNERLSDDWITTLAGLFILTAVLIPTKCEGAYGEISYCGDGYLFGHASNTLLSSLHLIGAALFLVLLGFMCIYKFTLSEKATKGRKKVYKTCGYLVWASVALLIILFAYERFIYTGNDLNDALPGYVFKLETVAVWAFGFAWLLKGGIDKDLKNLFTN